MPVIVVSHVPGLATALASRLDAVGVEPEDVTPFLESSGEIGGAIIDGASDSPTIEIATAIRRHDPWCPLILLLAGDELPTAETTDALEPVRLVRRPFTTATVVDHMISMQRSGPPRLTPELAVAATLDEDEATAAPVPRAEPAHVERSRWGRRPTGERASGASQPSISDAIQLLLSHDLPPALPEAAQQLTEAVAGLVTAETAIAVLVHDDDVWRVEAGRGVRVNETRTPVPASHWLAKHVEGRDTAVIVSGTDVARQELTGVPLIHHEYWLAVTMHQSAVMVIVGRSDHPPFDVSDAVTISDGAAGVTGDVVAAQSVRLLARRLEPYL